MPSPTTRHLVTSAVCAAVLLGSAAAPVFAAARHEPGKGPDLALTPVTRSLDRALAADDDPLSEAEAKELADAVVAARKEIAAALEEADLAREEADQARTDALAEAREQIDAALKEVAAAKVEALTEAAEAARPTSDPAVGTPTDTSAATTGTTTVSQPADPVEATFAALDKTLGALLGALTSDGAEGEVAATADDVLESLLHLSAAAGRESELPAV